jgi:hypothetical protein
MGHLAFDVFPNGDRNGHQGRGDGERRAEGRMGGKMVELERVRFRRTRWMKRGWRRRRAG